MSTYTFELVLSNGEAKRITIEANGFMQAFDSVVATYPYYSSLMPLSQEVL